MHAHDLRKSLKTSNKSQKDKKIKSRERLKKLDANRIMTDIYIVIKRHFPLLDPLLDEISDHRRRKTYEVGELFMAGLSMFVFKRGSRNSADLGVTEKYEENFSKLFKKRLPILDTVQKFLEKLDPSEFEQVNKKLVQHLIEKKVLEKWKCDGRYTVAVDGTGLYSFDKEPFEGCPHKTSKLGKKTWQAYALEAKLICDNGFCISLATEWLQNNEDVSEKQDCELKAFYRIAEKLKKDFPRLPITICADALYVNNTVLDILKKNDWRYILTFKDGTLKSVSEEVKSLYPIQATENKQSRTIRKGKYGWETETAMFVNDLEYKGHKFNWVEYELTYEDSSEKKERFVHITDLHVDKDNVWDVSKQGRMRWKIENEGFNTQKNNGYNLQHKYARKSLWAMKNYYMLLQIAHLIVQLTEKLLSVKQDIKEAGMTIKSLWERLLSFMQLGTISHEELIGALEKTKQLRY